MSIKYLPPPPLRVYRQPDRFAQRTFLKFLDNEEGGDLQQVIPNMGQIRTSRT